MKQFQQTALQFGGGVDLGLTAKPNPREFVIEYIYL